jgi:hypothetical protein
MGSSVPALWTKTREVGGVMLDALRTAPADVDDACSIEGVGLRHGEPDAARATRDEDERSCHGAGC